MFLLRHVDFVFVFLNKPSFSFYETGHKSVKVVELGRRIFSGSSCKTFLDLKSKSISAWAKNLLKEFSQNISRFKSAKVFELWRRIFFESSRKTFQDLKSKSESKSKSSWAWTFQGSSGAFLPFSLSAASNWTSGLYCQINFLPELFYMNILLLPTIVKSKKCRKLIWTWFRPFFQKTL